MYDRFENLRWCSPSSIEGPLSSKRHGYGHVPAIGRVDTKNPVSSCLSHVISICNFLSQCWRPSVSGNGLPCFSSPTWATRPHHLAHWECNTSSVFNPVRSMAKGLNAPSCYRHPGPMENGEFLVGPSAMCVYFLLNPLDPPQ